MAWGWDTGAKRYRDTDTGRFLPRTDALAFVQKSIDATKVAGDQLATFAASGTVSPSDFGALFKEELKKEYIRQYLTGIGGREQMTKADWGSIGGMLREQYKYLPGFVSDLESGKLSELQIQTRAGMYVNSAREANEKARTKNAKSLEMTEEKWELGEAEHCDDCLAYAGQGWQPIGTFPMPGSGSTACRTNCRCHKVYRNPDTGKMY